MNEPRHLEPLDLGDGICRIDTGLAHPGMAACYLVVENGRAALIDTGTWHSVPHILQVLAQHSLLPSDVDFVIPTHIHLDHAGGAGELMRHLPQASLVVHPFGAGHMIDPARLQQGAIAVYGEARFREDYHEIVPVDAGRVIEATDGFEIDLNGRTLVALDTPGHASHHICIWDERTRGFFTGDTFGLSYRETDVDGRPLLFPTTTPVQFKPEKWLESLDKLEAHDPRVMYLTHFGPVFAVKALMDDLRGLIRAHHQLAREHIGVDQPETGIRSHLADLYLERMKAHGLEWPEERMKAFIEMDLELNTQGLVAWIARNQ